MKLSKTYKITLSSLLLLAACRPEVHIPKPVSGNADYSTYVAIGDSQTAGYADGGLYLAGQQNSFPNIIAGQLKALGSNNFSQPLFVSGQENGSGYLKLGGFNADGSPILTPVTTNLAIRGQLAIPGFGNVTLYTKYTGDNGNYGVPGIKLSQITYAPYGNLNGYYERLLPNNSPANTITYLDYVTTKPFTFFTCWLGNNDALGYATAGGASDGLTDKTVFTQLYTALIAKLTAGGQKGVVATIPDVTTIPYFTTITTTAILAAVQKANPAATALYINAKSTADLTNTTYAPRAATANDLIILTFSTSKIGQTVSTPYGNLPYGLTPYTPIDNQYVLDANEVSLVKDYVTAYNASIKSIASAKGLGVFDAYNFLINLKQSGSVINGVTLSAAYITGGVFSLDGVHLTPRGYAIEANEFIKAANLQYNSTIPQVNISNYGGVKFP